MTSSFELKFVFGLFVLCVFQLFFTEAKFNLPRITPRPPVIQPSIRRTQISPPSVSRATTSGLGVPSSVSQSLQTLESHRLRPAFTSSQTSAADSMSDVVLYHEPYPLSAPSASASATLHRTSSSPTSFNTANSPSIMREATVLHREAASVLNAGRTVPYQNPSLLHRIIPNLENIKKVGNYLKNGAIAVAGTGGAITIVDAIKGDEHSDEKKEGEEERKTDNANRTMDGKNIFISTKKPDYHNPLGDEYK